MHRISSLWYLFTGATDKGITLAVSYISGSISLAVSCMDYASRYQLYGIGMAGAAGSRVKVSLRRYF